MKTSSVLLCLLLGAQTMSAQVSIYDDVKYGTLDATNLYYDSIPLPAASSTISAGNAPLQDISASIGTVTGLSTATSAVTTGFTQVDTSLRPFAEMTDFAMSTVYNLPATSSTMSSYSFGTFTFFGQVAELRVDFTAWAAQIALVRTAVLIVMTIGFAITLASTIRGYL